MDSSDILPESIAEDVVNDGVFWGHPLPRHEVDPPTPEDAETARGKLERFIEYFRVYNDLSVPELTGMAVAARLLDTKAPPPGLAKIGQKKWRCALASQRCRAIRTLTQLKLARENRALRQENTRLREEVVSLRVCINQISVAL